VKASRLDPQVAVPGAQPERHRRGEKPTVKAQFRPRGSDPTPLPGYRRRSRSEPRSLK
jgi:hypothetical protein